MNAALAFQTDQKFENFQTTPEAPERLSNDLAVDDFVRFNTGVISGVVAASNWAVRFFGGTSV